MESAQLEELLSMTFDPFSLGVLIHWRNCMPDKDTIDQSEGNLWYWICTGKILSLEFNQQLVCT